MLVADAGFDAVVVENDDRWGVTTVGLAHHSRNGRVLVSKVPATLLSKDCGGVNATGRPRYMRLNWVSRLVTSHPATDQRRTPLGYPDMASSDFDVLLDMGFDTERAEMAVEKTGGCTSLFYHISLHHMIPCSDGRWL